MPLGPDNPHGVGFVATETEFCREQEAIREVDPRRSRVWKIKNEASRNVNTGVCARAHAPFLSSFLAHASAACMHAPEACARGSAFGSAIDAAFLLPCSAQQRHVPACKADLMSARAIIDISKGNVHER
jgi:lipoate synthase